MCRIGAIKSKELQHPSMALKMMLSQQEGHDNSGFAMVMQDLGGVFAGYKSKPLMSLVCTQEGARLVDDYMESHSFEKIHDWVPRVNRKAELNIKAMPLYTFRCYDYPEQYAFSSEERKEDLLLDTRLAIRSLLEKSGQGYIYSLWPDVLTLKEIGDPRDIAEYFRLWDEIGDVVAKSMVVQCRQNTNYEIVRYAAHPFFIQGYTLCANGENTFFTKNTEYQRSLHRGYIGFESDSQNFLYTLHYVQRQLKWPIRYYKHVITPLPFDEICNRPDKDALMAIRQSLGHLEINGPNTIIGMLPDGGLITCCDSKKLRPVVVGNDGTTAVITSEVCGLNTVLPERDISYDIYPGEREVVVITPELEVQRWKQ
jgi:glutamate synthase domain-containing protein 1